MNVQDIGVDLQQKESNNASGRGVRPGRRCLVLAVVIVYGFKAQGSRLKAQGGSRATWQLNYSL